MGGGTVIDPFENMAASTIAMLIFFGSVTFATVSMITRMWLLGNKRAIGTATSIKLKSPFPGSARDESQHLGYQNKNTLDPADDNPNLTQSVESIISSGDTDRIRGTSRSNRSRSGVSSRSVAHARNASSLGGNTVSYIRMQDAFVQVFVIMYHTMIFGLVLLGLFLLGKYPPNGKSNSESNENVLSQPFRFNADQFMSWMIIVTTYTCHTSWQRNDCKNREKTVQLRAPEPNFDDQDDEIEHVQSAKKNESSLRQRQQSTPNRDETSTISRGSSHTGLSKCLEDIMLEEVLGHDDHDTLDDAFENAKRSDKGWVVKAFAMMGLKLNEFHEKETIRGHNVADDVLNHLQTLELKGMLSLALLLYQYCSSGRGGTYMARIDSDEEQDESSAKHLIWRNFEMVAFSSFTFLSGYNQTSFYYFNPDHNKTPIEYTPHYYGLSRVISVLFRWNSTAIFLSLFLGNNFFQHYAVCSTHSFFFLAIWLMLRTWHSINYTKYKFRLKIFVFTCTVISCDVLLAKLYKESASKSVIWEWCYLCHMHHLAAVTGIIFAVNKPIASLQLKKLESYSTILATLSKGIIGLALTTATMVLALGPLQRESYNKTHAHFGVVYVLTYIYWRNSSHRLRSHHNRFFVWIGQYSLELFLLSKHTLFHNNVLWIIPGYPNLNFLLVCAGVILLSKLLNSITKVLQQFLIQENDEYAVVHVSTFAAGIFALYLFAKLLCWADLVSIGSIATVVIILGVLLYQVVMDVSWEDYRRSRSDHSLPTSGDSTTKIIVPISGVMSICLLAAIWYGFISVIDTASINASCIDHVNNGSWLPINACNVRSELVDGINYFGYSECEHYVVGKEFVWPKQYSNCGFRFRSDEDIKMSLLHKRVTFIGDASILSLFYSLVKSMGDHDAGGYEGIASHSDLRTLFPSANIEYKWSPLSVDVVTKLKSIRTAGASSGKPKPDLVIVGCGAWDKLHIKATDEDQQSHRDTVSRVAFELDNIRKQGVAVVWVIPPVVNTIALNSDEKRSQMSEESLEETRQLYRDLGVEASATFVLEGQMLTKDRTSDSFDGIDFPPDVYDAGIQILANAFDWILESTPADDNEVVAPNVDISTNLYLSAQVLIFALIGLFFFDAYFGVSYLAQLFIKEKVAPSDLYQDATNNAISKQGAVNSSKLNSAESEEVMELLGRPISERQARPVHSSASLSRRR